MPRKWIPKPEQFIDWKNPDLYDHLDMEFLDAVEEHSKETSDWCRDPHKKVIDRGTLCALINRRLVSLGYFLETCELDFRVLAQYCFWYSHSKPQIREITISAPSRSKYLLVANGSAARISEFTIRNIKSIDKMRDQAVISQFKGRRAAMRNA